MLRPVAVILSVISATSAFAIAPVDTSNQLIISVRDQKLMLLRNGGKVATYPISTSMFGLGDSWTNDHSSRLFGGGKKDW